MKVEKTVAARKQDAKTLLCFNQSDIGQVNSYIVGPPFFLSMKGAMKEMQFCYSVLFYFLWTSGLIYHPSLLFPLRILVSADRRTSFQ